jgi:hypothetical protein
MNLGTASPAAVIFRLTKHKTTRFAPPAVKARVFFSLTKHKEHDSESIIIGGTNQQSYLLSMSNKVVHCLTTRGTMMNMKLTSTAFKRKNPATAALEESLRVDELLAPMQRKRRRHSLEDESSSNKSSLYAMSSIWRETEKLEQTLAFPTIEWTFDDDISVANERGSPVNDDNECIQNRESPNSATCLDPAFPQISPPRLLSKKSNNSNSLHSLQWIPELSSREERTRSFLLALGSTDQLKPPPRTT